MKIKGLVTIGLIILLSCKTEVVEPPVPFGPLPTESQLAWHDIEFYAFIHLTINTFTDKEWGFGDESPELFNPTAFDAEQIVLSSKNAGMKGLILTAKHHDGFCLWPTKTTEHNITKSPYKDGKGDIVKEIVDACRKHGLKVGMYLSPWDRNTATYGTQEYIKIFRTQLTELLTNYGDVFEVWFDGANGGSGYYGGANEERKIDRLSYYDWENTFKLVHELQPNAVIFSDLGPGVRWVGTEAGYSGDPCWHRYTPHGRNGNKPGIGETMYLEALNGHREGDFWIPAETNTSIRPGWFYHKHEDDKVKSPERLVKLYYESIGHGTNLILNLPPDRRGLVHENDVASLTKFKEIIDATFSKDLAQGASIKASNVRGNSSRYSTDNLLDKNQQTYWTTDDDITVSNLIVEFPKETEFNVINLREYIPLGQRIWGWAIDKWEDNSWKEFAKGESIGNRRLWKGGLQITNKIRIRITEAPVCPTLTEISVHLEPVQLAPPIIHRTATGNIKITSNGLIRFTLDGSEPTEQSAIYENEIPFEKGGTIKSKVFYKGESSETTTSTFTHSKNLWKIMEASSSEKNREATKLIDDNKQTFWQSHEQDKNKDIVIDFGKILNLKSFSVLPRQTEMKNGIITHYKFYTSLDGENWKLAKAGEFSNIINNPIEQVVSLDTIIKAKFIKFKAVKVFDANYAILAELGVMVD
ncbi:alpha-L-fucosidase [Aestuariivivens marinum]|uniref:alpha-L-fucosidase n=1 Tax=Aestuariivivens marinum TaxID=2913555 RepID=UPI001F5A6815|nr:alpha-L-fucosidase [Aestuariivivens marinum]